MRGTTLVCAVSVFGLSLVFGTNAIAKDDQKGKGHDNIRVHLKGFEEVPVVVTNAVGDVDLDINDAAPSIAYQLTYSDLEGTVTQSHIHVGQKNVNGGIVLWLCQTATNQAPAQAAATPTCPSPGGTVSGTLTPNMLVPQATQGIPAGAFADVLRAIRAGKAYANVHTSTSPGGEIRGQLPD